jgi:hypothetical protein
METPSTAQKRKRDALEEGTPDTDADEGNIRNGYSGSDYDGTPTKRLKSSGTFEHMLKRKENGDTDIREERPRADFKRRRV